MRSRQVYIKWLEATVLHLSYLWVTSDLSTQCHSRQPHANNNRNTASILTTESKLRKGGKFVREYRTDHVLSSDSIRHDYIYSGMVE